MKILTASQIRQADAHTIEHEPISSIDLMERAAGQCVKWIEKKINPASTFKVFSGPGNNGGDGLAVARMLCLSGREVWVYIVREAGNYSNNFLANESRLKEVAPDRILYIESADDFPTAEQNDCVIDTIFGTGLSKPVTGLYAALIGHINRVHAPVVAIDIPSGLYADKHTESTAVIRAGHTLSFQVPKLAFMFAENEQYTGQFHLLNIGLDHRFIAGLPSSTHYVTEALIRPLLQSRKIFSHKGNYGHALLVAGSKGKMGAAVLAASGCLRTGVGLLSVHVPEIESAIMQVACPEAMLDPDMDLEKYSSIGIGPGIGTALEAKDLLKKCLLDSKLPLVLDADALNILSGDKVLMEMVPANSILTPHPKEFERLTGKTKNDFDRHELQVSFSVKHKVWVVLKGAHSCITSPGGISWFNSTGNAGMAKGGSGDVLTGMITSLLAQGYDAKDSALLGVYLHGKAGDLAASKKGMDGMIARDIVNAIPKGWRMLRG